MNYYVGNVLFLTDYVFETLKLASDPKGYDQSRFIDRVATISDNLFYLADIFESENHLVSFVRIKINVFYPRTRLTLQINSEIFFKFFIVEFLNFSCLSKTQTPMERKFAVFLFTELLKIFRKCHRQKT